MLTVKRQYQDTLFKVVFGREDHKPWLLSLYNALNGSHYEKPDDLTINTIEGVIYVTMKNDVSFLLGSEMNLYEHQSTYNPNLPLRGLLYMAEMYQDYILENEINIFSSTLKKIPSPNFIVFYTGDRVIKEDRIELKLSDSFIKPVPPNKFEWTATLINLTEGHNDALNKTCKPLYDYTRFVNSLKHNLTAGMSFKQAGEKAVELAIRENLLNGFFSKEKSEVLGTYLHEFHQDWYERDLREEGRAEGKEIGRAEGARDAKLEDARNLIKMHVLAPEQIALATGLTLEEVLDIKDEVK